MSKENPCPICHDPMHPAMERRYGHCGREYCSGWTGSADRWEPPVDHRTALTGCVGTGSMKADAVTYTGIVGAFIYGISCTADDACLGYAP